MKKFYFIVLSCLFILLSSCSDKPPRYIAKSNTYTFNYLNDKNGYLQSESLVYVFNVESMQQKFYTDFCARVTDCSDNINHIKNSPLFGGFNLSKKPISNNEYGVKKVYTYRLKYLTTGQNHELRAVSGALFIPDIPVRKIKGIILYFHPTFFARTSTPSFGMLNNNQDNTLVSIFATNGYVIAAPDYIGMGIDNLVPHPFILYPLVNANDGLSMLHATQQFLNTKLQPNIKLPLFVTGFSEGSSYALWFSRLYQEHKEFKKQTDSTGFKLTLVAPIAGAYNLSNVTYNYLFHNISIWNKDNYRAYSSMIATKLKPGLLAFALIGYGFYNQQGNYPRVFEKSFFNMECSWQDQENCNHNKKQLNLSTIFNQKDDLQIVEKILNSATYKHDSYTLFTNQTNNIRPLVNPNLLTNPDFIQTFNTADIYYWHSTLPTVLIYLAKDSVVSPYNTEFAYRGMLDDQSKNLTKLSIDNSLIKINVGRFMPYFEVDHPVALPYMLLAAVQLFNKSLVVRD